MGPRGGAGIFTLTVVIYAFSHGVRGVGVGAFKPAWAVFIATVPLLFFNYIGFELPSAAGDEMRNLSGTCPSQRSGRRSGR